MKHHSLEVTFRRGRALAAHLYLPRKAQAKVARTTNEGGGLRVDFDSDGSPMGIEITDPSTVRAEEVNAVLARVGQPALLTEDWAPLRAA